MSSEPSPSTAPAALACLGWDDGWRSAWEAASFAVRAPGTPRAPGTGRALPPDVHLAPGRVCRADRGACDVLTGAGQMRCTWGADVVASTAGDPEAVPVAGDWVVVARWPDARATVEAVLARRACVCRAQVARGSSYAQVLAANVDVVAVVEGLVPDPDAGRVERLLALAWASGAEPVVLLTKADLVPDAAGDAARVASLAPGCPVRTVATPTGEGVPQVRATLHGGRTLALLGASGVGKSTLLNTLVGDLAMRTRDLRGDGKGRHTTVTRELHAVPGGGLVVDTPGLRSVGLVGEEALEDVFSDVEDLAASCRFTDCAHGAEPGCAVLAAVESGALGERRLASYRKLRREVEYQASRTDARLRAARAQRWKAVRLQVRQRGNRP
jgi:ribosome biogenesis GTPase / thiamine phosphate phosphatase